VSELLKGRQTWKLPMNQVEAAPRPLDRGIMGSMASAVGQVYPIIVLESDDGWRVWDGRVRYRCAHELGWDRIEAIIAEDEFEAARMEHLITLAGNARADNPIGDAKAIAALGDDEAAMRVSGLTRGQIRARKRLLGLAPEYQELLEEGHLALTAAKKLARLPRDEQRWAYGRALRKMREHNEERKRADRTVPTVAEIDEAVRAQRGKMQPAIPVMADRLKKAAPSGPDPVMLAARVRQVAQDYDGGERIVLEKAADILDGTEEVENG